MQWRVTLAVAVMCVGYICHRVGAEARGRVMVPRDYGVKLCGREFIRAVIFTCGGSRWRRSTDGDLDPLDWSSISEETPEDNLKTWQELSESRFPLPVLPSYSLTDLLSLFRNTGDREQPPLRRHAASDEEERGNEQRLSRKKKRNFSLGVAGMCCNQGCTKNDIGRCWTNLAISGTAAIVTESPSGAPSSALVQRLQRDSNRASKEETGRRES